MADREPEAFGCQIAAISQSNSFEAAATRLLSLQADETSVDRTEVPFGLPHVHTSGRRMAQNMLYL